MFERFTTQARRVVVIAQEQARRRRDDRIRSEHLLLALYEVPDNPARTILDALGADRATVERALADLDRDDRSPDGPVSDAAALATLGIDLDEVRRHVELAFGPGALDRTRAATWPRRPWLRGHVPFHRDAKKVLELALREAVRLGHDHIGTEHLLLGLLRADGRAAAALTGHGLRLDAIRVLVEETVQRRAG